MTSETGLTGKNAYIAFGGTVLNTSYRSLTANKSIGLVDQSAGADDGITRLTTLLDSDFSVTAKLEAGTVGTVNWANLNPGDSGTFEYGPEGTATNSKRAYVTAILESISEDVPYAGLVMRTFNFTQDDNAGVTVTVY
jgi:hypothetical protein